MINKNKVPIWHKQNLTFEEAAEYSGIGINRIRDLANEIDCPFVLYVGTKKKLIKREIFDKYIKETQVI